MTAVFSNRVAQPIRVRTIRATCDGLLTVGLGHRTLDELNFESRPFLPLHDPRVLDGAMPLEPGLLAIQKTSILLAMEVTAIGAALPREHDESAIVRNSRALVRLQLPGILVEGYIPLPSGGDVLTRLNQFVGRRFLAVTTATLCGSGLDGAIPFVAVNLAHVEAAQGLLAIEAAPEEMAGEVAAAR